jgi:hypothetical protein
VEFVFDWLASWGECLSPPSISQRGDPFSVTSICGSLPDRITAVVGVVGLTALLLVLFQVRLTRQQLIDSQLGVDAHEPVRLAHDISRLEAELAMTRAQLKNASRRRLKAETTNILREMHLDLADAAGEARRTAGFVMDFAGWEGYFADLLKGDKRGYSRILKDYEGWYTDHMFALFGRLYVRNPISLDIAQRVEVSRVERDQPWPSSLGEWQFHVMNEDWGPDEEWPDLQEGHLATAKLSVTSRERAEVVVVWMQRAGTHQTDDDPPLGARLAASLSALRHQRVRDAIEILRIKRFYRRDRRDRLSEEDLWDWTCAEIESWVAWHLAEGRVKSVEWVDRFPGGYSKSRKAILKQVNRRWMQSENQPRFEIPKYVLRSRGFWPGLWAPVLVSADRRAAGSIWSRFVWGT